MRFIVSFRLSLAALCACAALLAPGPLVHAHGNDPALFPAMIEAFTEELAKAPETDLFIQRGELYMHCEEWAKAAADFAAAAKLDPQRLTIGFLRARALLKAGRPADARPLVDHYLEQKPSQAEVWFLRGEIFVALGQLNRARADYAEGFRRAPTANAEQTLHWARLVAALPGNGPGDVLPILDEALARLGPAPVLLDYATDLEMTRGNSDAALARIDHALPATRWPGNLLARRGDVLLKAGRRGDAVASYRAALEALDQLSERVRADTSMQKLAHDAHAAIARLSVVEPSARP